MKKISRELMYVFGLFFLALGAVLIEKAAFGMSMIVAPAYIIYLKLSEVWSFFTFGMAEYLFQAVLIVAMSLFLRRFRFCYLLAFVTAVIYGFILDGFMTLAAPLDGASIPVRVILYILGLLLGALGVASMFKTYLMPEAYELVVKEIAEKTGKGTGLVKTAYDCISCALAVILSFAFFGLGVFKGVHVGTILCALINGKTISVISNWMDKRFEFVDSLPLSRFMK